MIDGVRTVVVWDRDFSAGELVEAEIAFFAQDDAGNVWELGEHPEAYEHGKIVESPTWIHGVDRARAGIFDEGGSASGDAELLAGPRPGVGFTDRARVLKIGDRTCIPARCFSRVLLVDEFNPGSARQAPAQVLRPGVGNVRVGWRARRRTARRRSCSWLCAHRARGHGEGPSRGAEARAERLPHRPEHLRAHAARRGRAHRHPAASDGRDSARAPVCAAVASRLSRPLRAS